MSSLRGIYWFSGAYFVVPYRFVAQPAISPRADGTYRPPVTTQASSPVVNTAGFLVTGRYPAVGSFLVTFV